MEWNGQQVLAGIDCDKFVSRFLWVVQTDWSIDWWPSWTPHKTCGSDFVAIETGFTTCITSRLFVCAHASWCVHWHHKEFVRLIHSIDRAGLHEIETTNGWSVGCHFIDCSDSSAVGTSRQISSVVDKDGIWIPFPMFSVQVLFRFIFCIFYHFCLRWDRMDRWFMVESIKQFL